MADSPPLQRSLEGHYYADSAIFAAERERIFHRSWQFAGTASALPAPGCHATIDVVGAALFVIRDSEGVLRAFRNVCPHRGSRLLEAGGEACAEIRCPYHDWRYALDGRLTATPWFGEETPFDLATLSLVPVAIEQWRGLVFVALAPAGSLTSQLGELPQHLADTPMEAMVQVSGAVRRAPFNWKAYLDQFNEYYHSPAVHSPDKAIGLQHYTAEPFDQGMVMQAPQDTAFYGGKWLWSWPNLTISVFPGGVKISRVLPLSAQESEVGFFFLFTDRADETAAQRQRVIDATLHIFEEDVAAVSRVQSNLSSGLFETPGPLHPRHEKATAYFQRKVREALA